MKPFSRPHFHPYKLPSTLPVNIAPPGKRTDRTEPTLNESVSDTGGAAKSIINDAITILNTRERLKHNKKELNKLSMQVWELAELLQHIGPLALSPEIQPHLNELSTMMGAILALYIEVASEPSRRPLGGALKPWRRRKISQFAKRIDISLEFLHSLASQPPEPQPETSKSFQSLVHTAPLSSTNLTSNKLSKSLKITCLLERCVSPIPVVGDILSAAFGGFNIYLERKKKNKDDRDALLECITQGQRLEYLLRLKVETMDNADLHGKRILEELQRLLSKAQELHSKLSSSATNWLDDVDEQVARCTKALYALYITIEVMLFASGDSQTIRDDVQTVKDDMQTVKRNSQVTQLVLSAVVLFD